MAPGNHVVLDGVTACTFSAETQRASPAPISRSRGVLIAFIGWSMPVVIQTAARRISSSTDFAGQAQRIAFHLLNVLQRAL